MQAVIKTNSFANAIAWATKHFDLKQEKDFVELYMNSDGQAYLAHQSVESYMRSPFEVESVSFEDDDDDPLRIALDGRYLKNLGGALSSGDSTMKISRKQDDKTTVVSATVKGLGRFSIPIIATATIRKPPKYTRLGLIDDQEFFSTLNRIARLCDSGKAGNDLTSVVNLMPDMDSQTIRVVATDRYAMASVRLNCQLEQTDENDEIIEMLGTDGILLPYQGAVSVSPTKDVSSSVELITERLPRGGGIRFGYKFPDDRIFLYSLISTPYPSIDRVLDRVREGATRSITVETSPVSKSMSRLSQLVWDEDKHYWTIGTDQLSISNLDKSSMFKLAVEDAENPSEEPKVISFLRTVIASGFSVVSTEKVKIRWHENCTAVMLTPIADDGSEITAATIACSLGR